MKFEKTRLAELPYCYATSPITVNGRTKYLFATDDTGPCYCIDPESKEVETVWDGPGGTMSIIPIPHKEGEFLASQNFMPGFTARDAVIVRVKYEDGQWITSPWISLPYVHRFDIIESDGKLYFLGCILSNSQSASVDWNYPGELIAAELNSEIDPPKEFEVIASGMTKNHGYNRIMDKGFPVIYTSCDEGVFEVIPPRKNQTKWIVNKILDVHASDVALCDIDNDGNQEIAVIEAFHGDQFVIYHKENESYQEVYRYPNNVDFLHVVWGGTLNHEAVFLGGCRELEQELFMIRYKEGQYFSERIESGYGPSNISIFTLNGETRMLVANRESAECAVFTVK